MDNTCSIFETCIFVNFLHKESIKSFINYVTFLQIKTWIKIYKITFEVELAQSMIRQVVMYFSIVRRRACWASLVKWSTSVITTTLNSLSLVVVVICCAELNKMEKNLVKSNSIKDFFIKYNNPLNLFYLTSYVPKNNSNFEKLKKKNRTVAII